MTSFFNDAAVSRDGRFVVYPSLARNVVPGLSDNLNGYDVFLYDRETLGTTLVSRGPGGALSDNHSAAVQISADGSVVAFFSSATNLTPEPVSGFLLYLFDRASGAVTLVGRASRPVALSADGNLVAFRSREEQEDGQVIVFDRTTHGRTLVSHRQGSALPSEGGCLAPSMSADGRFTAYVCLASDIVPGTLPGGNVFLHDRTTGLNTLVSPSLEPLRHSLQPLISDDGRYVAFTSYGSTLVPGIQDQNGTSDAFLFDRIGGTLTLLSRKAGSTATGDAETTAVAISSDGERVLLWSRARDLVPMEDDPEGDSDVFLYRRSTDTNELLSHPPGNPTKAIGGIVYDADTMSDDGGLVAFSSVDRTGPNTEVRLWVYEEARHDVRPLTYAGYVGVPLDVQTQPRFLVSGNGHLVAFTTYAVGLGVGIADFDSSSTLYGWNALTSAIEPLSRAGVPSRAALVELDQLSLSRNGRVVAFRATHSNAFAEPLAPPSGGGVALHDRDTGRTELVNWSGSRNVAATEGWLGALSGDGSTVLFRSSGIVGPGLRAPETGSWFAFDRGTGAISLVSRSLDPTVGVPVASTRVSVSDDGRFATFETSAQDVAGDLPSNGWTQVYLWSRDSGALRLVSRTPSGRAGDGPSSESSISADGSTIAFVSLARDLVETPHLFGSVKHVYLQDRVTGATRRVTRGGPGEVSDVEGGIGPYRSLSDDGRFLLYHSRSRAGETQPPGPLNLYRYDRDLSGTVLVSHGVGGALDPALADTRNGEISRDGRRVAFLSGASNLLPGASASADPQVFLFDSIWPDVRLVSRYMDGSLAVGSCREPRLSADGSTVAFGRCGFSPSFVFQQAFVYDARVERLVLASHAANPSVPGNDSSGWDVAIDEAGDSILFVSGAPNLGLGLEATDLMFLPERRMGLFAFSPPPIVQGSTPACANVIGGRSVAIQGSHFQPGATVTLDGVPAQIASVSSTAIVATAGARPAGSAHTGPIVVTNPNGEYFALGNAFTYAVRGDANNSGALSAADGFFLSQAVFLGGPQPASLCNGDANGSGAMTSADSFFLNLHLFLGGPPPPP
ncbi:MAG: IPT/TIG domain-containing protein [Acidobacteria bacterium]|nr:IPT/TIG domain-containing protein [Acidobacteriota bacterium]